MKVFLGGTCNGSMWRDALIPLLTCLYFNPVVEDWTPECQEIELSERETSDYVLYVLSPMMTGVYSIAELIDDSNKRPQKTLFYILQSDITPEKRTMVFSFNEKRSIEAVAALAVSNGATEFKSLKDIANFLNSQS